MIIMFEKDGSGLMKSVNNHMHPIQRKILMDFDRQHICFVR